MAALLASVSLAYNFFILIPAKQSFEHCLASYNTETRNWITEHLDLSTVDLCEMGYGYSRFIEKGRSVRASIRAEYEEKYANPDDYWIRQKQEKEINAEVKRSILSL